MDNRNKMVVVLIFTTSLLSGCANHLQLGVDAYSRGEYDKAASHWNNPAKAGNPYAQYNLGLLWEGGLGSTPLNTAQASQWYLRSAEQGFPPAMVRLAKLQLESGFNEAALSWFVLAARWGNSDAITELKSMGEPIPRADLLAKRQSMDARADARAEDEAEAALGANLGYLLGCAIADGECGSSPSPAPRPRSSGSAASVVQSCSSDYSCGIGYTCVKQPLDSNGVCMKSVGEYGLQQIEAPSGESVGPNLDLDGQCQFDTECPVGFRCDRTYKVCVTR